MNASRLTAALFAAGLLAAGAAQAQWRTSSDVPLQAGEASTVTNGVPNARTTNSPYPDGTVVLPAYTTIVTPAVVTAPTAVTPAYVTTAPVVAGTAVVTSPAVVAGAAPHAYDYTRANVTSDVPTRAGEASTFTNGATNLVTQNSVPVRPVYVVPGATYSSVAPAGTTTYIYRY